MSLGTWLCNTIFELAVSEDRSNKGTNATVTHGFVAVAWETSRESANTLHGKYSSIWCRILLCSKRKFHQFDCKGLNRWQLCILDQHA